MYERFYGLKEKPFSLTPDPEFLFVNERFREALDSVIYGIKRQEGFTAIVGDVGTGKTTVLRTLFEQLDERGHKTALIFNPCLSSLELLRSINREFGIALAPGGLRKGDAQYQTDLQAVVEQEPRQLGQALSTWTAHALAQYLAAHRRVTVSAYSTIFACCSGSTPDATSESTRSSAKSFWMPFPAWRC